MQAEIGFYLTKHSFEKAYSLVSSLLNNLFYNLRALNFLSRTGVSTFFWFYVVETSWNCYYFISHKLATSDNINSLSKSRKVCNLVCFSPIIWHIEVQEFSFQQGTNVRLCVIKFRISVNLSLQQYLHQVSFVHFYLVCLDTRCNLTNGCYK
jgi:hypothetical protein